MAKPSSRSIHSRGEKMRNVEEGVGGVERERRRDEKASATEERGSECTHQRGRDAA